MDGLERPAGRHGALAGRVRPGAAQRRPPGGIALVTTLIARRAQLHQANLATNLDPGTQPLLARIAGLTQALQQAGSTSVEAARRAYGVVYRQLAQQAQTLAYLDVLFVFACFAAAMVPLVFLTRRGAGAAPAH